MSRQGFIQSDLDLKMLVLYIMDRIAAPITFLQLLELALCDAGVDYFSLHEAVEHLVRRENLLLDHEHYSITEKGRRNSEICEDSLPYSVRCRCDDNLIKVNEAIMREKQVQGHVISNDDGTAAAHLQLSDDTGVLLDLKILTASPEQASDITRLFKSRPESTYHKVVQLLSEEESKS